MAIIGLQKGSGKRLRVREKSVKSQGILIRILSGNPEVSHASRYHKLFGNITKPSNGDLSFLIHGKSTDFIRRNNCLNICGAKKVPKWALSSLRAHRIGSRARKN